MIFKGQGEQIGKYLLGNRFNNVDIKRQSNEDFDKLLSVKLCQSNHDCQSYGVLAIKIQKNYLILAGEQHLTTRNGSRTSAV